MLAQDIIEDCEKTLQDPSNARWSLAELLSWLNEGQRTIVKNKPNAYALTVDHSLVSGTYQTMPVDGIQLLDVIRNSDVAGGRVARQASREELDGVDPNWHTATSTQAITQYTYTAYDPLSFYVYPPNDGTGSVVLLYSAIPPEVDDPLDAISIPDFYRGPLVDYVLYRCFQKDAEDASNLQLAQSHFTQFMQGLALLAASEQINPPSMG